MKRASTKRWLAAAGMLFAFLHAAPNLGAQRQLEALGRGIVAVDRGDGTVHVSWRLLAADPAGIGFHLYRVAGAGAPVRLSTEPITQSTSFIDRAAADAGAATYFVRAVIDSAEGEPSRSCAVLRKPYLSVPLQTPPGCTPNDASVGDLDGDGEYELVLKQEMRPRDNARGGETGQTKIEAYRLDGTFLWRIDLGRNIREGAHTTQFMVYDLDGDGRAEVACKTADGTIDRQGTVIGDAQADHRNGAGYVLEGPEFLTIFDGRTGAALATTAYLPPRGKVADWGDGRDEIVYGACAIDDDGKGLYSTGLGHGDAMHLSDIDPDRPGIEVFSIHERPRHAFGANLRDAATGAVL